MNNRANENRKNLDMIAPAWTLLGLTLSACLGGGSQLACTASTTFRATLAACGNGEEDARSLDNFINLYDSTGVQESNEIVRLGPSIRELNVMFDFDIEVTGLQAATVTLREPGQEAVDFDVRIEGPDADNIRFFQQGNDVWLQFVKVVDFEEPGSADRDNDYEITIAATTADIPGFGEVSEALTFTVTDAVDSVDRALEVEESNSNLMISRLAVLHPNLGTGEVTISGADAAVVEIAAVNGDMVVRFRSAPDYEAPDDTGSNNIYEFTLTNTDTDVTANIEVSVADVERIVTPDALEVNEGVVEISSLTDLDAALGTGEVTITGDDAGDVEIAEVNGEMVVRFASIPDYEAPDDTGSNNIYEFTLTNTDIDVTANIEVSVADVERVVAPDALEVNEGVVEISSLTDLDAALGTGEVMITGDDAGDVEIAEVNGEMVVRFASTPDYEAPDDANSNNDYVFTLTNTDTDVTANIEVSVADVERVVAPDALEVNEGVVMISSLTDLDAALGTGDVTITGDDAGDVEIAEVNGEMVVRFASVPDYEDPDDANSNNDYVFTLTNTETDVTANIEVSVADVERVVTHDDLTVDEGDVMISSLTDLDADFGTGEVTITGDDAGDVVIAEVNSVMVVRFVSPPDFEAPADADFDNIYEFTLTNTETDVTANIQVTVDDVQEVELESEFSAATTNAPPVRHSVEADPTTDDESHIEMSSPDVL